MSDIKNHADLIRRYGVNPTRWPEALRAEASQILADHPEIASQEAALDQALDQALTPAPHDLLRARILRDAKTTQQETATAQTPVALPANDRMDFSRKFSVKAWGAIAATLMICGALGWQALSPAAVQSTTEETIWLEAAADLGIDDLYSWVEGEETNSAAGG